MKRAIVSVATGRYVRGLDRLTEWCARNGEDYVTFRDCLPARCPPHADVPYAFKASALEEARQRGFGTLLWCDAAVVPIRPLEPLWDRIESEGAWIANNGWTNDQWTADSAYEDLFPGYPHERAREINRRIPHVVATAFGLRVADLGSRPGWLGSLILSEYFRLASKTSAFCGPWINSNYPGSNAGRGGRAAPCGPPHVLGHRHDQTALSTLAWRFNVQLTNCPEWFAYRGNETDKTVLISDGSVFA